MIKLSLTMGREEPSNFSTLLFALLIFLPFVSQVQPRTLPPETCSSSCGDNKNISYPFRLKTDPDRCGHRDYELSCESNQTILELNSGKYYVKQILYDEHLISIVDVNFANGSCSLPYGSQSVDGIFSDGRYSLWPRIHDYYYGVDHYSSLVNCSDNINDKAYIKVSCLSGNQSYVYFIYDYLMLSISNLPESCEIISRIIVHEHELQDASGVKNTSNYRAIQELLQSGFELGWLDGERDCWLAGGQCFDPYDQNNYVCNCQFSGSKYTIRDFIHTFLGVISSIIGSFLLRMYLSLGFLFLFHKIYQQHFVIPYYLSDYIFNLNLDRYYYLRSTTDALQYLNDQFLFTELELFVIVRFIFFTVLIVFVIHKYIKTRKTVDDVEKFLHKQQSWVPKRYSYIEIIAITNHFRYKLGQGGFGSVYKGQLLNGCFIAVKVLENSKFSGEEFINEVSTIGRIHHANVVRLLGFCSEGSKRALVYEYMPNGSLDRHIFIKKGNGQAFGWEKLHEIALGTAHGIEYLHNGCDVCILHFDIKPHNILLDCNFIPKVGDFGLAKFHPKENDFICISATRGTIGYIAPELISRNFGTVSCKSDVYSFGMLLLEIAGGRRNSYTKATRSSKAYFPSWVYDQMIKGRDLELQNVGEIEGVIARKLCIIGLCCIQVKATDRPSITKVVEMLEGSTDDLQMPPKPFFDSSSQQSSIREIQSGSSTELLESESIEECSYSNDHTYDV